MAVVKARGVRPPALQRRPRILVIHTPLLMSSRGERDTQRKAKIPSALRQAAWVRHFKGRDVFSAKCPVAWCPNTMTAFNFHAGHEVPAARGGATTLEYLVPICAQCNLSMGDRWTISEWSVAFLKPARVRSPYWPPAWRRMPCSIEGEGYVHLPHGDIDGLHDLVHEVYVDLQALVDKCRLECEKRIGARRGEDFDGESPLRCVQVCEEVRKSTVGPRVGS